MYFAILVYVDSGSILPKMLQFMRPPTRGKRERDEGPEHIHTKDVLEETEAVEKSDTDPLRVFHVSKTFGGSDTKAVDDVSFGVSQDTVFALLGPNGAGERAHTPPSFFFFLTRENV